jgi:hypothetical protein
MGDSSKIARILDDPQLKAKWKRLDVNARRFLLANVPDGLTKADVLAAIAKYKRERRRSS